MPAFFFFQHIVAKTVIVFASIWLLLRIAKMDLIKRNENVHHAHQSFSIFGIVMFYLLYMTNTSEEAPSATCLPIQYCFTVFLTLTVFEYAELESQAKGGGKHPKLMCLAAWVFPTFPIAAAFLLGRDICWLHLGPEMAFAIMLPLIVVSSCATLLGEKSSKYKHHSFSGRGHFHVLTSVWLFYFSAVMISQYEHNVIYLMCFVISCYNLAICFNGQNPQKQTTAISDQKSQGIFFL